MELKVAAVAGTTDKNDIFISIEPSSQGIEISLKSKVMEQFGDKQKKIKWIHKKKLLSIRYSPVYSGTTACVVSLMVLWRKTVAEKWPISRQRL